MCQCETCVKGIYPPPIVIKIGQLYEILTFTLDFCLSFDYNIMCYLFSNSEWIKTMTERI